MEGRKEQSAAASSHCVHGFGGCRTHGSWTNTNQSGWDRARLNLIRIAYRTGTAISCEWSDKRPVNARRRRCWSDRVSPGQVFGECFRIRLLQGLCNERQRNKRCYNCCSCYISRMVGFCVELGVSWLRIRGALTDWSTDGRLDGYWGDGS